MMLREEDDDYEIAFRMPSQVRTPTDTSTPAAKRATMEMQQDRSRLLAEIDFDDPEPVRSSFREDREEEMTVKPERSGLREKTRKDDRKDEIEIGCPRKDRRD